MKKTIRSLAAAAAVCSALCFGAAGGLTAHAEGSVQDVYNAMRRIGMPEGMINQAKNAYQSHPELHDANGMTINGQYASYADWADTVIVMEDTIWNKVAEHFGVDSKTVRQFVKEKYSGGSGKTNSGSESSSAAESSDAETGETERPSDMKFIKMSLEEKKAYIQSLPEDERAKFLANMTTGERNSIIKQMSTEDKAELMEQFADVGRQLGMNVSVDKIDGSDISYSVRDADGNLIDSSSIGTRTDDTGWDLTAPVIISAAAVLLSAGGFIWICKGMKRREEESDV